MGVKLVLVEVRRDLGGAMAPKEAERAESRVTIVENPGISPENVHTPKVQVKEKELP